MEPLLRPKITEEEIHRDELDHLFYNRLKYTAKMGSSFSLAASLMDTAAIPFNPELFGPLLLLPGGISVFLGAVIYYTNYKISKIERKYY